MLWFVTVNGLRHSQRQQDWPTFSVLKNRPAAKLRSGRATHPYKRQCLYSNCMVLGEPGRSREWGDVASGQSCWHVNSENGSWNDRTDSRLPHVGLFDWDLAVVTKLRSKGHEKSRCQDPVPHIILGYSLIFLIGEEKKSSPLLFFHQNWSLSVL